MKASWVRSIARRDCEELFNRRSTIYRSALQNNDFVVICKKVTRILLTQIKSVINIVVTQGFAGQKPEIWEPLLRGNHYYIVANAVHWVNGCPT